VKNREKQQNQIIENSANPFRLQSDEMRENDEKIRRTAKS